MAATTAPSKAQIKSAQKKASAIKKRQQNVKGRLAGAKGARQDNLQARLTELRKRYRESRRIETNVPSDPGEKTPVIPPFMNADDMLQAADAWYQYQSTLGDIDYELTDLRLDTDARLGDVERSRKSALSETNDVSAARGVFNSSIRDGQLLDVEATAAIQRNLLNSAFDAASMNAQRRKLQSGTAWDMFQVAMKQQMVENAQAASEGLPEYVREPVKAHTDITKVPLPKKPSKKAVPNPWGMTGRALKNSNKYNRPPRGPRAA